MTCNGVATVLRESVGLGLVGKGAAAAAAAAAAYCCCLLLLLLLLLLPLLRLSAQIPAEALLLVLQGSPCCAPVMHHLC